MQTGDKVYYLHTDKNGVAIKYAAVVLAQQADGVLIRVGRYDVHTREVSSFESVVPAAKLQSRSVPCSYEEELTSQT